MEGARGTEDPERALKWGKEGIQDEAACWACRCWCTEGCRWNSEASRDHRCTEGAWRAQGTEWGANAGAQAGNSEGEGVLVGIHDQDERTFSETRTKDYYTESRDKTQHVICEANYYKVVQ